MNQPEQRPDPDALLAQMQRDEAAAKRGALKIFFGASAGVGKTYAMLAAARARLAEGAAVVIGVVETHGRHATEAMARELPRLPLRDVGHRGRTLREFDIDAALAFGAARVGALVLLDELAHSNAPGSRHPKRWQDAEELLAAGIDVWTTMNVQHLESLNDVVSGITGVPVWETVPDRVFDEADEVVVVDLPPDELLQRLRDGKVYLPQQAERAAAHFFRKGNLLALRELALRRTADRVDDQMIAYRQRATPARVWPAREALLACIGPGEHGEKVVRSAARLAAQLDVPWHALHVEMPARQNLTAAARERVAALIELAQRLGATTATLPADDAAQALVRYARTHNLSRLVLGRRERRWRGLLRPSLADAVAAIADDIDVLQVALPAGSARIATRGEAPAAEDGLSMSSVGYAGALLVCIATALAATPLLDVLELSNIVMIFLLAVVGVALRWGRGPAVLAAVVGVALFDVFFVPPRFTFAVDDAQYLVTFGVMLVVALVIGQLTAGLKRQAEAARRREHRVHALYELSRELSGALMAEQVAEIGVRFLHSELGARAALLGLGDGDRLAALPGGTAPLDAGVAQWAFDRGRPAGRGTDTLPASACLVLPLRAPMRTRGVLGIEPPAGRAFAAEDRQLLDTCASLLAISLERIHYVEVAQSSTLQIESERLRNSLLSAISHDLRTPLAALVGQAESLRLTTARAGEAQAHIVESMRDTALRMSALVDNLLDMARLQSGTVQLNRQWQPLEEVVGSALAATQASLGARPVRVRLDAALPLVHIDAVLFERVFVNLLENAARYTDATTPIEIGAAAGSEAVRITVDDRGPGLPAGREEAIFEKFERGRRESATPGAGLGLAICRAIVQAHGGTIRAENREGGGARFAITLPRGEPPVDDGGDAGVETGVAEAR